uniref:EF-hand domain-containing protein n=1 Tax=Anabas testudineus TaxID=64144 RepID=A0A3Q1HDC7_ANATE
MLRNIKVTLEVMKRRNRSLNFSLTNIFILIYFNLNGLDSRDLVCRELSLSESEVNKNSPLVLELVKRGRHKDKPTDCAEEPSQKQITSARKKFDLYDKDQSGSVLKDDLNSVFTDLFPSFNGNVLERFITDELRAADKTFSNTIDFQLFLGLYKRLFTQYLKLLCCCFHVVHQDSEGVMSLSKGDFQQQTSDNRTLSFGLQRECLDLNLEVEDDVDDGDSFFDDPLPKPQKTYGW